MPDESDDTHEAIARDKAAEWSRAASMLAIASDGGLVIPALGELWESRHTHRFAGPAADDSGRLERLLELMSPYQGADRQASWVEAVTIAQNGRVLASWEVRGGTGFIAETRESQEPVPEFWAFTIWQFPQFDKTYNQLTPAERASINDHWAHVGQLVRRFIRSVFVPPPS